MWNFVRGGLVSGLDRLTSALTEEARSSKDGHQDSDTPLFCAPTEDINVQTSSDDYPESENHVDYSQDEECSSDDDQRLVDSLENASLPADAAEVVSHIADSPLQSFLDNVVQTCIWSDFLSYFEEIAKVDGTMISRDSKNMTRKQYETLFPGQEFKMVPGRGFLYCKINKKHVIACDKDDTVKVSNRISKCEWTVHFRIDIHKKVYAVIPELTNIRHSHAVNRDAIRASGRRLITYEKEMEDEETRCVLQYGPALLGVSKTRDIMRLRYPDRDYCTKLLSRLLTKGFNDHYGTDPDGMMKFNELGNSIRDKGGVFELEHGVDRRITSVFVMKPSMNAYVELFGDFVINDGTHNIDKYGTIMMLNTLVDSLGKSVMSCYSQFRSERHDHLVRALNHFKLNSEGMTLMTDDGPAYHLVAQAVKAKHLLCSKHYHSLINKASAGQGHNADNFSKAMFKAIYHDFKSADTLEEHFKTCMVEFGSVAAARTFITGLKKNQKLVCRTHTIWTFSAGCKSTQRGEGSNSRLKIGSKKREMCSFNMYQLLEWYLAEVELQEESSIGSIIKYIGEKRLWSPFVEKIWQKERDMVRNIHDIPVFNSLIV